MNSNDGESAMNAELARLASVDLNLLAPLMALLEERSVTRAAAKVGLSQPAMSHGLHRMRRLFGDELLVRNGRGMTLTPRGVELIGPLRQALHQTARIVSSSSFDPAVDRRLITVAMTGSTAFVIGNSIARLLATHAPNVVLRIRTTNATTSAVFSEDPVDVVLLSEQFASPYSRERLYDDRWIVVASPGAPEGASATELLATLPHVVFDALPTPMRPYEILDEEGLEYAVRYRISDYLLIPHLVAGSGGVAVHRYQVGVEFSGRLELRIEEFPFPIQTLGIDMIWNPWLADDGFKTWLHGILVEAAAPLQARYTQAPQ